MIRNIKTWGFVCFLFSSSYLLYKYKSKEIADFLFLLLQQKKKTKKTTKDKNENEKTNTKNVEEKEKTEKEKTEKKKTVEDTVKEKELTKLTELTELTELTKLTELTDIEDINTGVDRNKYGVVQIKRTRTRNSKNVLKKYGKDNNDGEEEEEEEEESDEKNEKNKELKENCKNKTKQNVIIAENYKIYFKSFGCAHNSSDSEFMMGLLSNYGFQFVKKVEDCDICIINSCTVKNPSEESMKTIINYVNKLNGTTEQTNKKKKKNYNNKNNRKENESFFLFDPNKMNEKGNDSDVLSTSSGFSDLEEASDLKSSVTKRDKKNEELCETAKEKVESREHLCGEGEQNCCQTVSNEMKNQDRNGKKKEKKEEEKENDKEKEKKKETETLELKRKKEKGNEKKNIKLIVCGCVPQAEKDMDIFEKISLVGVNNIDKIIDVVENVINGYTVKYLKMNKTMTTLSLPKIRKNKYIEIININNGCLGNCTYCKTKFARGNLCSYSIRDIIERIEYVINEENIKEIWMTSEDTGAYGIDLKTNIVELLKEILKTVEKTNVMIRLGMTNPPYILNHITNICKLLKHKNMYEFIHIPVQSGSNNVLKNMKREYVIEDFIFLVENLRKSVMNVTIATDIICGFPYETEQDHKETVELIKKYQFPILNISQFYPRRGTVAFNMKKINTQIVKRRSKEITDTFLSYNNYDFLNGTLQQVLFTEVSSRSQHLIGHTKQYVKVLLPNANDENAHLIGCTALCKIVASHKWHVMAELSSFTINETCNI